MLHSPRSENGSHSLRAFHDQYQLGDFYPLSRQGRRNSPGMLCVLINEKFVKTLLKTEQNRYAINAI